MLLSGCGLAPTPAETGPPAFDPAQFSGGEIFDVVPDQSQLLIRVYRDGPMARMGHNHVISTSDIRGAIYHHDDPARSGVVLTIPVHSLEVDNAELRRADPDTFDSEPSDKDIAGTRRNMLGDALLDAGRYPNIHVVSVSIDAATTPYNAVLRLTIKDRPHDIRVPVKVEVDGERMTVRGHTGVRQTDLGLEPYSVMMGALRVQDEMDIRIELVGRLRGR